MPIKIKNLAQNRYKDMAGQIYTCFILDQQAEWNFVVLITHSNNSPHIHNVAPLDHNHSFEPT